MVNWGLDPFKNEKSSENLERFMCGAFFGVLGNQNPKMLVCDVRVLKEEPSRLVWKPDSDNS